MNLVLIDIDENKKFNDELLNLISEDYTDDKCDNDDKCDDNDDNICLIDGQILKEYHIKLQCSHKFNYLSILDELKIQRNYNMLEVQKVGQYQIKCPYCRNIHNGILPYYKTIVEDKIRGVNWPPSKVLKTQKCKTILKSGKRKGEECGKLCIYDFCNTHKKNNVKTSKKTCSAILKNGPRKGKSCQYKCKEKSNYCGRHIVKKSI